MHLSKIHFGVKGLWYCKHKHLSAWNLFLRTTKLKTGEKHKDHNRLHDLILKRCKTLIWNDFPIFAYFRIDLCEYVFTDHELKQDG